MSGWFVVEYADTMKGRHIKYNKTNRILQALPSKGIMPVTLNGFVYKVQTKGKEAELSLKGMRPAEGMNKEKAIRALEKTYLAADVFEVVMPVSRVISKSHRTILLSYHVGAVGVGATLVFTHKDEDGFGIAVRWFPSQEYALAYSDNRETAVSI